MNTKQFEKYNSIPADKFQFANEGVKLSDTKLDTKPTTFAKDSFRRFCKNKSSVVAAFILGIIILMAIFVPVFSPYDTDKVSSQEQFLQPKLFNAGTGFWDGTTQYKKTIAKDGTIIAIPYDSVNDVPAGMYKPAVMNLVVDTEPTLVNKASQYATGGYVMFENQTVGADQIVVLSCNDINITKDGKYRLSVDFGTDDKISNNRIGEYRVLFQTAQDSMVLRDWGRDYGSLNVDLSYMLSQKGLDGATGKFIFELKGDAEAFSYLLIDKFVLSADTEVGNADKLAAISFDNASEMVLRDQDGKGNFPFGYWSCTGRKGVHACEVYYCEFTYDTYAAVYDSTEVVYASSQLNDFVQKGYCTFEIVNGEVVFERLSDECPIESIVSYKLNSKTGKLLEVTAMAYRYSAMGYKTMPRYLLGTDSSGVDVFTRMFKGLRTSLLLGVCTFAFCFMFGLVWGSISGYFGGWVDLSMERFCDILGGVPWIVVMTLCILHLGNNFGTFVLALCLTGWMGTAHGTRTQFYRFKHMEYVLASRTLGSKDLRLIFKHILPNSLGTIVTSSVLMIPSVIFSEASLAYLNLGLQGMASFGVLLSDNQKWIQSHPYLIVWPSVVMALLMISFNLFGNGLRDAINPTLKGA